MAGSKKYNNIFLISFVVSFIQFCFLFMALFGSKYFFEAKVLIVSASLCAVWFFLFLYSDIKNKQVFKCFLPKAVLACLSVFLGLWFVWCCWYYGYQTLDPMKSLFYGKAHTDTLFHSTIAESFAVNGYSSLLQDNANLYHYHYLSHFVFSVVARLLNIPCLVVYNCLYPLIFVPLFIYLFQSVVIDLKKMQGLEKTLSFWDSLFIILCCCGFFCFSIMQFAGLWFHYLYLSESTFVSVVCLFLSIKVIVNLRNVFWYKVSVAEVFMIPVLIIIISAAKISTGVIFYLLVCYYLFRQNPLKIKTYVFLLFYTIMFLAAYKMFARPGELSDAARELSNVASEVTSSTAGELPDAVDAASKGFKLKISMPRLFDYVRTYAYPKYYLFHYMFLMLPSLLLFFVTVKDKIFSKVYFQNKDNIIPETAVVISLLSLGPGIVFIIVGGSAFFFCIPAFLISCLLLSGMGVVNRIENLPIKWKAILFCLCLSSCIYPKFAMIDVRNLFFSTLKKTDLSLSEYGLKETCFLRSDVNDLPFYKTLNEVRQLKNRKEYCIYLDADCDIFKSNGFINESGVLFSYSANRPFFAVAGYTGIFIINAHYDDGEKIYRPDDVPVGSSNTGKAAERITLDNVKEYAKAAKKSHVIVLTKDTYYIIDCD